MMNKVKLEGLEPYEVDSDGNIYGFNGKVLKPYGRGKGKAYGAITIFGKHLSVHRLVAYGFGLIESLEYDGKQIDHINEIKNDNRLSNLQVLSNSKNVRKSKGGDLSLPKGVSYIKTRGLFRYTTYNDPVNYPKGKIIKSSRDLNKLLKFIADEYRD